jgi:uncharacterized protein YlaN (UPF0358 family)
VVRGSFFENDFAVVEDPAVDDVTDAVDFVFDREVRFVVRIRLTGEHAGIAGEP